MLENIAHASFLGLLFSVFRAKDGADLIGRGWYLLSMSVSLLIMTPQLQIPSIEPFIAVALLVLLLTPGWGQWFSCVNGVYHKKKTKWYTNPVNWVLHKLMDSWGPNYPYLAGVIGMSNRWLWYGMPLFYYLDEEFLLFPWTQSFWLLLVGPIYFISGWFYRVFFPSKHRHVIRTAEYFSAFLLGFLLGYWFI